MFIDDFWLFKCFQKGCHRRSRRRKLCQIFGNPSVCQHEVIIYGSRNAQFVRDFITVLSPSTILALEHCSSRGLSGHVFYSLGCVHPDGIIQIQTPLCDFSGKTIYTIIYHYFSWIFSVVGHVYGPLFHNIHSISCILYYVFSPPIRSIMTLFPLWLVHISHYSHGKNSSNTSVTDLHTVLSNIVVDLR